MGNVYFRMKELSKAVEYYQKALRLNPDFAEAAYNLTVALIQSGRTGEAARAAERARAIARRQGMEGRAREEIETILKKK